MKTDTTSQEFFDAKYQVERDPWQFASSSYERSRYDAIMHALAGRHYQAAFEPGCSIGVLTAQLAAICDCVQAMDIAPIAVQQARARCEALSNVEIVCGALPGVLPRGDFDLIVFSEVGYYMNEAELAALAAVLITRLRKGGVFLASHWLGESQDHLLTGDQVHGALSTIEGLVHERAERYAGFRLDRWGRL